MWQLVLDIVSLLQIADKAPVVYFVKASELQTHLTQLWSFKVTATL